MTPARLPITLYCLAVGLLLTLLAAPAGAQGFDPEGRVVRTVTFSGLVNTPEQLARNNVRTAAGGTYRARTIQEDIENLTFLGAFETVRVDVQANNDNSVNVTFVVVEYQRLLLVEYRGIGQISEDDLDELVRLDAGDRLDMALVERGARAIEAAYEEQGFFAATVTYDEDLLAERRELVYSVVEGPRVRIIELRYEGNVAFDTDELSNQVESDEFYWPFYSGYMDRAQLDRDVAAIRDYYRNRGFLNCQVGRRIDLSPRQNHATVTFLINEGPQYTVRDIQVRFFDGGLDGGVPTDDQLMSAQQIRYAIFRGLVRGGVYSDRRLEDSVQAVRYWYGEIGFINTDVRINRVFDPEQPLVDVVVDVSEGTGPTHVGDVTIIGLTRTQQRVLLRRVRGLEPGRPINLRGMDETRDVVRESIWFTDGTITLLGDPDDPWRDVLIEASEKNTGTFSIGLGLNSDLGVFGAVSLEQRNFDIQDWPESWDEFLNQRAFLGAGQTFSITVAPGNDNSTYSIGFREPYLFESDYFFDGGLSSVDSTREDYDENRASFRAGLGRRLGDVWSGSVRVRAEHIDIREIEPAAPVDVFAVAGGNTLTALGLTLVRSTTDSNLLPSQGSRLTLSINQFGAMGGDFDFTRLAAGYSQFWTLDEDFLGRKTILSINIDTGFIPQDTGDVPVFERFYAGGREFRGFAFRGVGPRGIRNDTMLLGDDPIGGRFQFIARTQYEFPIYEQLMRWAFFVDQGTIQDDFGFDEWRVSVGTGMRLNLPFFGQAPIAIDFGFPLIEEDGDESQIVSFNIELPFR